MEEECQDCPCLFENTGGEDECCLGFAGPLDDCTRAGIAHKMGEENIELSRQLADAKAEVGRLRKNLAMHETPVLCVVEGWPKCREAIELLTKAGIDFKVVDVEAALMMDHYGDMPAPPYLRCDCPGGSGIERIEELVRRAVPFVSTGAGGHR